VLTTKRLDSLEGSLAFLDEALSGLEHDLVVAGILNSCAALVDNVTKRRDDEVGDVIHGELEESKTRYGTRYG
jgi:hypothetical protein